jgi:hypothetical protein
MRGIMRFALHLFGIPTVMIASALFLVPVGEQFEASTYLIGFAQYIHYISLGLFIAAAILASYNGFRVWRAYNGKDEDQCYTCGMPTSRKVGRYGPYFSCWNCGTNRADR